MQEGRTLEDTDTVERTDIEEKRRLIDDLEQSSEEQGDRVFKDPGIEKRIHTEERESGCHDLTGEGILTSVETVNDEEVSGYPHQSEEQRAASFRAERNEYFLNPRPRSSL